MGWYRVPFAKTVLQSKRERCACFDAKRFRKSQNRAMYELLLLLIFLRCLASGGSIGNDYEQKRKWAIEEE